MSGSSLQSKNPASLFLCRDARGTKMMSRYKAEEENGIGMES